MADPVVELDVFVSNQVIFASESLQGVLFMRVKDEPLRDFVFQFIIQGVQLLKLIKLSAKEICACAIPVKEVLNPGDYEFPFSIDIPYITNPDFAKDFRGMECFTELKTHLVIDSDRVLTTFSQRVRICTNTKKLCLQSPKELFSSICIPKTSWYFFSYIQKVGVTLHVNKNLVKLNEPVHLTCKLTNKSDQNLSGINLVVFHEENSKLSGLSTQRFSKHSTVYKVQQIKEIPKMLKNSENVFEFDDICLTSEDITVDRSDSVIVCKLGISFTDIDGTTSYLGIPIFLDEQFKPEIIQCVEIENFKRGIGKELHAIAKT
jgi:hypothetical protein